MNSERAELAKQFLCSMLTGTVILDDTKDEDRMRQGLVDSAFDLADRFMAKEVDKKDDRPEDNPRRRN